MLVIILFLLFGRFQDYPPKSEGEVVKHKYYTLAYSEEHEQALWVYYVLTPKMINGTAVRDDNFTPDPEISTGSAITMDYLKSGYDKGHLCPAASMTINQKAMSESFYMSNMSPQAPSFNRIGWQKLESIVRNFADKEKKIHVVTGPILDNPIGEIGKNGVTVPSKYYKVVYSPRNKKMIAFIMPNAEIDKSIERYAVSVDSIEALTGIDFFHNIPNKRENKMESAYDVTLWSFEKFSRLNTTVSSSTTSVQCKGVTKSEKRCKRMTTNPNGYCHQHQAQDK